MDNLNDSVITDYNSAWVKYPKFKWLYDNKRLLDLQKVEWFPYPVDNTTELDIFNYGDVPAKSKIYAQINKGINATTYVAVHKGEIKWMCHSSEYDGMTLDLDGGLIMVINAILSFDFRKFSGMVSITTIGKTAISATTFLTEDQYEIISTIYPDIYKQANRLYNNRGWNTK